jgi:hypothetical protein
MNPHADEQPLREQPLRGQEPNPRFIKPIEDD